MKHAIMDSQCAVPPNRSPMESGEVGPNLRSKYGELFRKISMALTNSAALVISCNLVTQAASLVRFSISESVVSSEADTDESSVRRGSVKTGSKSANSRASERGVGLAGALADVLSMLDGASTSRVSKNIDTNCVQGSISWP